MLTKQTQRMYLDYSIYTQPIDQILFYYYFDKNYHFKVISISSNLFIVKNINLCKIYDSIAWYRSSCLQLQMVSFSLVPGSPPTPPTVGGKNVPSLYVVGGEVRHEMLTQSYYYIGSHSHTII